MVEFIGFSKVEENDIKELAALGNEIWSEHYGAIIGDEQVNYMLDKFQSESAIKSQLKEGYEYFFIKEDSLSIGYIGILKKQDSLFLSKFYLKAEFRKKGYGRKSLEFVKRKCIEFGLNKITLSVNKNNTDSICAYEKLGFKKTDSIVSDIGDGFVMDDYIYTYLIS